MPCRETRSAERAARVPDTGILRLGSDDVRADCAPGTGSWPRGADRDDRLERLSPERAGSLPTERSVTSAPRTEAVSSRRLKLCLRVAGGMNFHAPRQEPPPTALAPARGGGAPALCAHARAENVLGFSSALRALEWSVH